MAKQIMIHSINNNNNKHYMA